MAAREVASGEVDSSHIATATRSSLRGVHARQGEVVAIDLEHFVYSCFRPQSRTRPCFPSINSSWRSARSPLFATPLARPRLFPVQAPRRRAVYSRPRPRLLRLGGRRVGPGATSRVVEFCGCRRGLRGLGARGRPWRISCATLCFYQRLMGESPRAHRPAGPGRRRHPRRFTIALSGGSNPVACSR
jgi:hypothetical protein